MSPLLRDFLGVYCLSLIGALLYLLIALLPAPAGSPGSGSGSGLEGRLLLLVVIAGALGASVHMATSFALFAGRSELAASWLWWYLLRPPIGAALGTVLYLIVRGVMFSAAADAGAVNTFGALAFAGLAGMFSKQAIEWLRQVFDQMFRRLSDVEED